MWKGTGGVQPEKERHLVEGIWARPLLGGLGRTETSSGSPRGENKHAGGGCVWGDLSSLDGRTVHQSLGSRSEQAASEGGGLLPSKRLSQSGMNWSLSWVMISKEPFSRHTRWESLKPLKVLRGGNSLVVQGLGLCAFTARDTGSVPVWGTQISQALQHAPPPTSKKKRGCSEDTDLQTVHLKTHHQWLFAHRQAHSILQLCSDQEETLELGHSKLSVTQDFGGTQSHTDQKLKTSNREKNQNMPQQ